MEKWEEQLQLAIKRNNETEAFIKKKEEPYVHSLIVKLFEKKLLQIIGGVWDKGTKDDINNYIRTQHDAHEAFLVYKGKLRTSQYEMTDEEAKRYESFLVNFDPDNKDPINVSWILNDEIKGNKVVFIDREFDITTMLEYVEKKDDKILTAIFSYL